MPLQLQDCLHLLGWLKPPSKLLDIHLKFCAGKSIFTFVAFEMRHMLMNVLKRKTKEKGVDRLDHNFGLKGISGQSCVCSPPKRSLHTRSDIRQSPTLFWTIRALTPNINIFNFSGFWCLCTLPLVFGKKKKRRGRRIKKIKKRLSTKT